jgi:hypothetical protein
MREIDKEKYFAELESIELRLSALIKDISLSYPKAENLKKEKETFFSKLADDLPYNPQFIYEKREIRDETIHALEHFEIDTHFDPYGFKKLYKKEARVLAEKLKCFKTWGESKSTLHATRFYGKPSKWLLKKALKYCKEYKVEKVKFKTLTVEEAAKRIQKHAKKLTGRTPKVRFSGTAAKVDIQPKNELIKMNPNERFTSLDVKRLKVHEIGVHYLRYFNAREFGIDLLETGTPHYIETEEGLAAYTEELCGVSSKAQHFIYAGRVIATYYAPKKSFWELFSMLKKLAFRDDIAFAITLRAKRNISDTSQKGGYPKDYVYFSGYYKVKKYAQKNDIKKLFIGKIGLEDLKTLRHFINEYKNEIKTPMDEIKKVQEKAQKS